MHSPRTRALLCVLMLIALMLPLAGCGTIIGTAVSPITGAVDLPMQVLRTDEWYLVLPVGIAGMIGGPFVAFYNGIQYDVDIFDGFGSYWMGFDRLFRPYEKLGL